MDYALSTNWNSARHADGAAVVDEIVALGFTRIEIGYAFQAMQVPGLLSRLRDGTVAADSVHAYSPVPLGAPGGHPELFLLAATEEDTRCLAIFHLRRTLGFAATVGARAIVVHAGRAPLGRRWTRLLRDLDRDDTDRDRIEKSVAVVNAVYGAPARLRQLAEDIVDHWEKRRKAMSTFVSSDDNPTAPGKAMVVGATR